MKRILCMLLLVLNAFVLNAQSQRLSVTTNKTLCIVFPHPILHVDRGTQDVLAQSVKDASNILLVKAAVEGFKETNLSVVTRDGNVYAFQMCYGEPSSLVYTPATVAKSSITTDARALLDNGRHVGFKRSHRWGMEVGVWGMYVKDDVLFVHLHMTNHSNIDYDIDLLRFFIQDKRVGKRTASQEKEMAPLHTTGNIYKVKARSGVPMVVALPKFTIPDQKQLLIELTEKDGGRHFQLKLGNRHLLRAITLPDYK